MQSFAALCLLGGASADTWVSLDAAWKFVLGDDPAWVPPTPECLYNFTIDMTDKQCNGLSDAGVQPNALACQAAGCAAEATVWQWCGPNCTDGGQPNACWVGSYADDCQNPWNNTGWISFATAETPPPAPPAPPPPPPVCPGARACADYDDSAWRTLNVPHDFIVEGVPNATADRNHGYLPFNVSYYRKHFTVPADWKAGQPVWIDFDGVYRASDYWLNGVWIGHWESGYAPFRWYLHNATGATLNYGGGDNVLAVRVDGGVSHSEGWFYEGGGIYRHVSLHTAPAVNLVPWGVYAPSVVTGAISSPQGLDGPQTAAAALVTVAVDVQNSGAAADTFAWAATLYDAAGAALGVARSSGSLAPGGWARNTSSIVLAAPVRLWSVSTPYLHTLAVVLTAGSGSVDAANVTIGVRSAIFDANAGLLLNGLPLQIKGFSQHIDFGGTGTAVPDRISEYRVSSIKAIGANGWRTAHNPVAKPLLDAADRLGLLVWSENRNLERQVIGGTRQKKKQQQRVGAPIDPSRFPDPQYLLECAQMVLRDRNHPSIIIWSICNEGGCFQGSPLGGIVASAFKNTILDIDGSRPVTGNTEDSNGDRLSRVTDLEAFSYNYGEYDAAHARYPWKPVVGGESASCVSDRGYYGPTNATTGYVTADDIGCVVAAWQSVGTRPWVIGNFAWTGQDYKGEPSPLNWPCINSHFGVLDIAGFEKDSAGYYRAWWRNDSSAVSLLPASWNHQAGTVFKEVVVFAVAASAELFVNGASVGVANISAYDVARFPNVAFAAGSARAVAYDASGAALGSVTVFTSGPAAALRLSADAGSGAIAADGADVALLRLEVVDAAGALVPDASPLVTYAVASGPGTVLGVANGDPADHTCDRVGDPALPYGGVWARPAYHGLGRAIVQSAAVGEAGAIVITASAPGLAPASFTVNAA